MHQLPNAKTRRSQHSEVSQRIQRREAESRSYPPKTCLWVIDGIGHDS